MSSITTNRKETERTKLIQEKCQTLLTQMLRDEDNKYCVDCDAKGPRWASWNLGVFLCIRCAGIHRNLGVHISRVKSVNLDTWTPEQVISLQQMGNSRARAVYEAQLPDNFRRPQIDTALESFIRAKYEHKKYLAREWVPPSPPKVDWAREIDEELEKQKRKKKAAQTGSSLLGLNVVSDKKFTAGSSANNAAAAAKTVPLPAPLSKAKTTQAGANSTTTQRTADAVPTTNDLLGLASPTKPTSVATTTATAVELLTDLHNDSFSQFLSAAPAPAPMDVSKPLAPSATTTSLAQEEQDFFKQGTLQTTGSEKDKTGKLTKDSILALYGNSNNNSSGSSHTAAPTSQMTFGQPHSMFTGLAPAYLGASAAPQQFMAPPNSVSMYNAPVMAAPNGAQFQLHANHVGFPQQMPAAAATAAGLNMHLLQNQQQQQQQLLGGISHMPTLQQPQQPIAHFPLAGGFAAAPSAAATGNANLNKQFGNLNIGNVWQ